MRRRKTLEMVRAHCSGKVLDLGCGTGSITNYLFNEGFDVEGCDMSKKRLNIAKKNNSKINYFYFDIEKDKLKNKYDTIILMGVLEGLELIPEEALQKVKKYLNNGGKIIFEVPNFNSLQRRFRTLFGFEPLDPFCTRNYNFTKKRVIETVKNAHCKIIKLSTTKFIQTRVGEFYMPDAFAQEYFVVIKS